jgi:hypothetical protein
MVKNVARPPRTSAGTVDPRWDIWNQRSTAVGTPAGYAERIAPVCHFPSINYRITRLKRQGSGQVCAVMESCEENALNDVDRISRAVDYLRDLLVAATEAELRANRRQLRAEGSED